MTAAIRTWFGPIARALAAMVCVSALLSAQARDERTAGVGMRAHLEQVVLPGTELEPARTSNKAPVILRVLQTWPHGELLRYDFEWTGFEPGDHDLTKFLVRKDGSSTTDLPPLVVHVTSALDAATVEPADLAPKSVERLGGYRALQIVVGVLWGLGLLAILFVGRRFRRKAAPTVAVPTLADRLRPLVEEVASGRADDARKAELERLLVAFWRARLDLGAVKAADAIVAIRRHAEAGALLRQIEAWLHMPTPPAKVDVAALLAPYRAVTADSFAPIAAPAGSSIPSSAGAPNPATSRTEAS